MVLRNKCNRSKADTTQAKTPRRRSHKPLWEPTSLQANMVKCKSNKCKPQSAIQEI